MLNDIHAQYGLIFHCTMVLFSNRGMARQAVSIQQIADKSPCKIICEGV